MSSEDPRGRFGGERAPHPPEEAPGALCATQRGQRDRLRSCRATGHQREALRAAGWEGAGTAVKQHLAALRRRRDHGRALSRASRLPLAQPRPWAQAASVLREGSRSRGDVCSPRHRCGGPVGKRTAPTRDPGHVTLDTPSAAQPALRDPGRLGVSSRARASSARGVLHGLSLWREAGLTGTPFSLPVPGCVWVVSVGVGMLLSRPMAAVPTK